MGGEDSETERVPELEIYIERSRSVADSLDYYDVTGCNTWIIEATGRVARIQAEEL